MEFDKKKNETEILIHAGAEITGGAIAGGAIGFLFGPGGAVGGAAVGACGPLLRQTIVKIISDTAVVSLYCVVAVRDYDSSKKFFYCPDMIC